MNYRKYMIIGKIKKLLILGEFKIIKIISNKLYKINWNKKNINYWKGIIKTNIFILIYVYDTCYESFLKNKKIIFKYWSYFRYKLYIPRKHLDKYYNKYNDILKIKNYKHIEWDKKKEYIKNNINILKEKKKRF